MRPAILFIGAALLVSVPGCSRTHQVRSVEPSGFLGDYSQLRKGEGDEAALVYINPQADWAAYDKVLIDPVSILVEGGRKSAFRKVSREDLQMLADYLHTCIQTQMAMNYRIADQPGPGVLRIRAAITEAKGSKIVLDTLSNVMPPMIALSAAQRLAVGTNLAVGRAGVEAEILDSLSGERLAAVVDRRAGRKVLRGKLDTWDDVREAYSHWAEKLRMRLLEERSQ